MSITEVRGLPLREKLQIFEAIREDLSTRVDEMAVTPVVRELLDARIERVRSGSVDVHEWDAVKFSIGQPARSSESFRRVSHQAPVMVTDALRNEQLAEMPAKRRIPVQPLRKSSISYFFHKSLENAVLHESPSEIPRQIPPNRQSPG